MEAKMYRLGSGKMEEINPLKKALPFGSRVIAFGAYNCRSSWGVCGDNRIVKMSSLNSDDYFAQPFRKIERTIQPLSEKFGIGFYYDDIDIGFRYSKEEITEAIIRANDFIEDEKRREYQESIKEENLKKELPNIYPHLTPNPTDDYRITKRNLVAELKHRFPTTKFRVNKRGYKTYNVYWEGSTEVDAVRKVRALFEDHVTDQTGDFRDYSPSVFNRVFGGFKYIFLYKE